MLKKYTMVFIVGFIFNSYHNKLLIVSFISYSLVFISQVENLLPGCMKNVSDGKVHQIFVSYSIIF